MGRVQKRDAAKRDLIAQWAWYAENASIDVADRFLDAVGNTLTLLSAQPQSGSLVLARKRESRGLRRFPLGDGFETILLFCFPLEDGVDLVRVVYGSRYLKQLLDEGVLPLNRRDLDAAQVAEAEDD
jgi:toxin ParE1/3/4